MQIFILSEGHLVSVDLISWAFCYTVKNNSWMGASNIPNSMSQKRGREGVGIQVWEVMIESERWTPTEAQIVQSDGPTCL